MSIFGTISFYEMDDVCNTVEQNYPSDIKKAIAGMAGKGADAIKLNLSNRGGGGAGAYIEGTVVVRFSDKIREQVKLPLFTPAIYVEWDDNEGTITGSVKDRKYLDVEIQGYADNIGEAMGWMDEFFDTVAYEIAYAVALMHPEFDCDV